MRTVRYTARQSVRTLLTKRLSLKSSSRPIASAKRVKNEGKRLLTLETTHSLLEQAPKYQDLLSLDCFAGYVRPDLPLVTSVSDIFKCEMPEIFCSHFHRFFRLGAKWMKRQSSDSHSKLQLDQPDSVLRIETVAAQVFN